MHHTRCTTPAARALVVSAVSTMGSRMEPTSATATATAALSASVTGAVNVSVAARLRSASSQVVG